MCSFKTYISRFDLDARVTDEEIAKTKVLLNLYGPVLHTAAHNIDEMEERCSVRRSQTVSDYINLAVDYDHDADCKRIADRLSEMGHSMQLLSIMEDALLLLKSDQNCGGKFYDILRVRYFDSYCTSHEDAYLTLSLAPATYYRNLKKAVRRYAAYFWYVVLPDLMIAEKNRGDLLSFIDLTTDTNRAIS